MRSIACDAFLFDLDRVLVDSTAVVVRTWRGWAEKWGFDAARILEFAYGWKAAETTETIYMISPDLNPDLEVQELEHAETENLEGVLEVEGACELLASLPLNCWTVVTSGTRSLAEGRMTHLGLPMPERFVTADDVSEGKLHPEAYLKGRWDPQSAPRSVRGGRGRPLGDPGGQGRRHARRGARHDLPRRRQTCTKPTWSRQPWRISA